MYIKSHKNNYSNFINFSSPYEKHPFYFYNFRVNPVPSVPLQCRNFVALGITISYRNRDRQNKLYRKSALKKKGTLHQENMVHGELSMLPLKTGK